MSWWQTYGLKLLHEELHSIRRLIMATREDLNAKLDELQQTLDAEQEQVKGAIDGLNETLQQMRDQEIPQEIIDRIESIRGDLASTIPDEPAPDAEGEPA